MKKLFPIYAKLLIITLALTIMTGLAMVSAQTAVSPPDKEYEERTRYMARFLLDKQPTQDLQPMSNTLCVGGFAGDYPCDKVDLLSFLPLSEMGGGSGNDIWGWTDSTTGKEYAIMGRTSGTSFIDISDPVNPIYLGNLPTHTSSSTWRDVKVYADHAFIVSEAGSHGMQIFDLTQLRDVTNPPVEFSNTAHYSGFGSAHNIVINEDTGFAYGVGANCSGGLHMVDISDPINPTDAGCFSADGYTHDAQCVIYNGPDTAHVGSEICLNSNEDTLTIVDVTNKANPQQLSRTGYTGSAYAHQGWLTEDHTYFLLDDELDESNNGHNTHTYIWDVSDLDSPQLIDTYVSSVAAIDHNMYVKDDFVYQANYRAGLRILDLSDVANGNLSEFAYFDIYPSSNSAAFNGAWSTYPYFDSGVVIVSGIEQGLFVLRPALEADFRLSATPTVQDMCVGQDAVYDISVTSVLGFSELVTLSAPDLPTNMTASFSENPVVPDSVGSELTLGTTAVATGTYMIDILGASPTRTHTSTVQLDLYDQSPALTSLLAPVDEAVEVDIPTVFSWETAVYATNYTLEVATDDAFNNTVYTATVAGTSLPVALDPLTTYYWRVQANNACGQSGYSDTFSFTTRDIAPILLVDDDDNSPNVRSFYEDALDAIGAPYELWDTNNSDVEPTAVDLAPFETVIWFSGDEFGGAAGPGSAGEAALASWLDEGNCLFLSSQDYRYDRGGVTSFMNDYLGVSTLTNDDGDYSSITGQGTAFSGFGPYTLDYGPVGTDYSDPVTPNASAEISFMGNNNNGAGVAKDSGVYKTTFWPFSYEAIATEANRIEVMSAILTWCGIEVETGFINGTVTDSLSGATLAGATVTADGLIDGETMTDGSGYYTMTLPVGTYELSVELDGYVTAEETVSVVDSTITTEDVELLPIDRFLYPSATDFVENLNLGEIATQTVTFSNTGTFETAFTLTSSETWLVPSVTDGTVSAGESMMVDMGFDATAVYLPGTYTATISIAGDFENQLPDLTATMIVTGAEPSIALNITVSTQDECGSESEITIDPNTVVYYCYTVTNTGNVLLSSHTIEDSQFGQIDSFEHDLFPGASASVVQSQTVSGYTTSMVTWRASQGTWNLEANTSSTSTVMMTGYTVYLPFISNP